MDIALVEVPYDLGAEGHGAARAAQGLARASAESLGISVTRVARRTRFRDTGSASLAVNRELGEAVRSALAAQLVPVVVAGSCDASLGVVGAFEHDSCGIVWFDGHGDFNTPETTVTGFFGGMPLAVLTGHCFSNLWSQIGDSRPVADDATLLVGAMDLDPLEQRFLEHTDVSVCGCSDGRPLPAFDAMLRSLEPKVSRVYLHFDLDVLDPSVAPGLELPVAGGLSMEGALEAIRAVARRFTIQAATIATTFDPDRDADGRTLQAGVKLVEELAAL